MSEEERRFLWVALDPKMARRLLAGHCLVVDGLLSEHEECRRKFCGARCSCVWISSKQFL
jgi:hypothetical protein